MTKKTVWRFLFCLAVSVLLVSVMSACGFGMLGEDDPYDDPYYDEDRVCVFYYWNDENNNVSEFYVTEGSSSASFDPPYREGYRFNGLFTDAQGGSMVFDADGRAVVVIDTNMNLYAQWTPLTYSIVFDAKEGTLTTAELERNVTSGSKLIEFPAATREGYTFNGWKNSRGELVTQGNTFVEGADTFNAANYPADENGVVRLTADYTIQECLITFDFCDGREPLTQSVFWGSPVTQIEYPQEDTGSAEIVSWSLSSGTQIDYADTTIKTDITFYAIWRDYKVFTYHLGNGADNIVEKVYNGVSYNPPQPQRNGYSFAGWYSSDVLAGFPEQSISYHSYYSEFYAKWSLDTYTVFFEPYGGTGELSPLNYDFEHALALPVVEKEYCTFLGWCRNADLSDAPMTELPAGSYGDVTLYAKYEGRKTFVYLDAGEGKLSDDSFSVEYSAWNYLPVPEYEGYIFRGWYLDDTQMTDGDGKTLELWSYLENGLTLTAQYAQAYTLTVQINNEKGAIVNVRDKYAQGDEVLFDLMIAEGWTLVDLKSDYGYGIKAGETFEMPAKNVTITITVEPNTYNVTLFAGENAYLKTDSLSVDMNSVVTLPTPAMQGHRFIGWFYGDVQVTDGGGALCSADGWNIASDVTLSAKYENDGNTFVFIQSAEDLFKIRDNPGGKYRLLCDIRVDNWETIDFPGTFDGGGYKISGLRCPLFGTVTGTVENLTLQVNITNDWAGNNRIGGVACYLADYGMIRNVTVEGSIRYSGTVDVGGIAGFISNSNTTLTGCTNYAEILVTDNGGYSVGGIVGATNACASTFANNKNYGSVTNLNGNTGGIFGYVERDGVIKNCENHSEKIKGLYVGGIIGNATSGTVAIDSCSSKGTLEGEEVGRYVGRCNSTVVYTNMPAVTVTNAAEFVEAIKYNVGSEDIVLEADIDLSGINWKPYELHGNLIGNGHTIKNLSITSSDSHVGMFTVVRGTVKDLTLVDFNIVSAGHSGCAKIGAVCGDVIEGTISNVTVESGSITGAVIDAGGISGYLSSGSISNCVNHVDITAQTTGNHGSVGGIVGYMIGGTLTDCENYGTIQTPYRVGGICGGMVVGGDNYTKNLANYGSVIGTELVGGLYGFYDGGTLTIDSCTVRANIIGSKVTGRYAGKGNIKYLNLPVTTISTLEEFAQIRYHVAEDTFILQNDIVLDDYNWITSSMSATLDGNGHKVTGLTAPLFETVTGHISNLEVHYNISMEAPYDKVGGVACKLRESATITNVHTYGSIQIKGNCDLGGIVGFAYDQSVISECTNHANVTITNNNGYSVGGICGAASYVTTSNYHKNYGNVTNATGNAGGIFGYIEYGPASQIGCHNSGNISGVSAGGIVGVQNRGNLTVDSCTVDGFVKGTNRTGKFVSAGGVEYLNVSTVSIKTVDDLLKMSAHAAPEVYILEADLDLTDVSWTSFDFTATFNGNGHKITGLTAPLFVTVTGSISDLEVHYNISMDAPRKQMGGVACMLKGSATITNVTTYGSISVKKECHLGGIVGYAFDQSIVTDCTNYATVTLTDANGYSVGGICGVTTYATAITNNKNYGDVTNAGGHAGGIYGYVDYGPANLTGCHNSGKISGHTAGGLVGIQYRGTLTVDSCTVDGFVTGTSYKGKFLGKGSIEYLNLSTVSIKTVDDFLKMSAHAAPELYILEADLDLTDVKWTTCDFTATLDGNGHKITGLTVPLFMTVTGNISNLEVHYNISMDAPTENVGGVAYTLRGTATIDNVHTYGSIQIKNNCFLGGIVGRAYDKSVITNCSNHANVTILNNNGYYIGGICGVVAPTTTVNSNKNYGDVTNAAGDAGGILGYVENGPYTQTNSYNGGKITGATAGGIIGVQYRGTVTIDNCTVDGIVKGTSNTGKFVGRGGVAYQNLPTVSIKTVDDLLKMAVHVVPEIYVLEADLDLSEVEWTAFDFCATFDGNGHKITGLNKNLFNKVTGTVKNLTLEKVNINTDGQSLVAALALDLRENALIENVTANGTITAANADYVGGIVCYAYGNSVIRGCKSYLNIDATTKNVDYYVGGILGGIADNSVVVENCINYGAVKGNSNVGGIMGYYCGYKPIVGCSNYGTLTSTHRTGGIVGYARRSLIIDGCGSYGEFGEGAVFGKYVCTGTVTYQNLPVQEIDSYEDLLDLKYNIKEETYVLVKDIDMTGKTWTPIELLAKIDGNGHKILGLTLNAATGDLAMFTKIRGSVENLTLENINVTSTSYEQVLVAGLCAELIDGTLKNVTVTGTLTAQSGYAAAVVAKQTSGTVEGCVNHASVKSKMTDKDGSAAGVIGWYAGGTVRDCKNYGKIEKQHCAGGVIGYMSAADAMGLTNYGEVSGKTETGGVVGYLYLTSGSNMNLNFVNEGKVTGADNVGGVFGNFTVVGYNTQTLVVNLLTNKGAVTGENKVGGIFGYFDAYATNYSSSILTATVSQLENTGSVTGKSYVGGIIGRGSTDTGNSKFVGVKSAAAVKGEYYVGGLAGRLDYIVLEDCSNAGSTVTATGYLVDGSNYYTYLGGYVGYGYGITNCINDVSLSYTQKGSYIGGLGGYLTGNILSSQNNASITATKSSCVGGVAGCNVVGGTTMYNVKNYGEVKGGDYTGGLIGKMHVESYNTATLTLTGFENHAAVTGGQYTGGLFGHVNGYATNYSSSVLTLNATGLINTGNVTGKTYVGGFIGYGYTDTSESVISDSKSSCAVEGEYYVGGLAGYLEYIRLSSCSNEGSSVKATGYFVENSVYYTYLGGYAGRGYAMTDCVNDVKISYTLKGGYVGGLAGYALGAYNDCVNNGEVYAPKSDNVGGIAGYSYLGVDALANNENTGAITGNSCVGGIAGKMYGESYSAGTLALHGFKNSGEIKGTQYTGGIVGHAHMYAYQYNSSTLKLLATGFANTGKVTGTAHVGGLFGYGYADTTESAISDSSSSGAITGESYVGGLAGQLDNIQMNSCSNEGASVTATGYFIDGSNYFTYLGGYVGRGYVISDCENAVNISYTIKGAYIGGIAGYAQNHFNSCVNKGNIYAPNSDYVGGVMGCSYITSGGTVEANSNSGTVTGKNRVGGIVGKLHGNSYDSCTLNWKKQNNTGTVKGEQYVGGIAGEINASAYHYGSSIMTVLASELNNAGSVTGTDFVGGLAGEVYTDSGNSALTGYMSVGEITCEGENTSDTFAKATNFIINN